MASKELPVSYNFTNRTDLMFCQFIEPALHGNRILERIQIHLSSNNAFLLVSQISIILIISLCIQILLKPLKQPRVISDMIAGLIIGPSFLGRNKVFKSILFPERSIYMLHNVTQMAMMFFFFANGVQMDFTRFGRSKKRAYFIGLISTIIPFIIMEIVFNAQHPNLDPKQFPIERFRRINFLLTISVSTTSLHVVYPLLKELNLVVTDIGQLSISCSMISDMVAFGFAIISKATIRASNFTRMANVTSYFLLILFFFSIIRPLASRINRRTPYGRPVKNVYIMMFLLGIVLSAFATDIIGSQAVQGPMILAMAIPEGPPLAAALVRKTEVVGANILMPILFAQAGLVCDFSTLGSWLTTKAFIIVMVSGYLAKFFFVALTSILCKMSMRDSISLGLVMSFRAQIEVGGFVLWQKIKIINQPVFTMLLLCTIAVTSISSLLLRFIYIPTLSYMTKKPRTILHSGTNTKFNLVACVYSRESVPAIIQLLRASNPTRDSPVSIYVLQLVELIGKYRSIFISHNDRSSSNDAYRSSVIWKAFEMYKQTMGNEYISFNMYTIVSPYKTMYHDICKLALDKKATMIILPVHNKHDGGDVVPGTLSTYFASQLVNANVMAHAPCSIGFLFSREPKRNVLLCDGTDDIQSTSNLYRIIVLFLGGADAREALAYADLMVNKDNVSLTVVRFWVVEENNFNIVKDDNYDPMEKRLDQECLYWFVTKNLSNDRVEFMDFEVQDGVELIDAIKGIDRNDYDLWMVGKERGMNPILIQGLIKEDWMIYSSGGVNVQEGHPELGVIGDFISSSDFEGTFSVLVIQQQIHEQM